jgi:CRISPR/Cas system CSM-associated protein Csm3 (group 7 of RAMP superfamily)
MSARWNENRKITRRIVVTGKLTLTTPARFGGGNASVVTDMPILRDTSTNAALLPGSSIVGAMRAYLRERLLGYEAAEPRDASSISQKLFGDVLEEVPEAQRQSRESYLTIDDALAEYSSVEFRPGVKINSITRIAEVEEGKGGQLYDMELLEAGTSFPLTLELDLPDDEDLQSKLLQGFAIALTGFENSEIGLGARKRRGFGECKVTDWTVKDYDL